MEIIGQHVIGRRHFVETVGENKHKMMMHFLSHFFFVEHDHDMIDMFHQEKALVKMQKFKAMDNINGSNTLEKKNLVEIK